MTVPDGEFAVEDYNQVFPVDVRIVEAKGTGEHAPDYGACSYFTVPLGATATLPVQVLQRRPVRKQGWIRNHDTANYVVIAQRPENLQQQVPQGFIIPPGSEAKIESQQGYWAVVMPAGINLPGVVTAAPVPVQPAVPATGVAQQNVNQYPVQVVIGANGATITAVVVNGVTVGTAAGTYTVPANGAISISYTVATPTWAWSNTSTVTPAPVTVSVRDEAWAVKGEKDDGKHGG